MRTERYRLTVWGKEKTAQAELYDHECDPHELVNLARDPGHAEVLTDIRRVLKEGWQRAVPPQ